MNLTKRQKEIIDAALQLTADGGIQNLTIKHVSGALGITEPALYRHFKNKAEIVKVMIVNFEELADAAITDREADGLCGIETFVKSRFTLVAGNPPLAKVMFSEELFMDDEECSALLLDMMHRHRGSLRRMFLNARKAGEIRGDIEVDMLFRLVLGPVRLLIKQWGMSKQAFDLVKEGNRLWNALCKTLKEDNPVSGFEQSTWKGNRHEKKSD